MADLTRYGATRLIRDAQAREPLHFATFDLPANLKGYADVDWFDGQPYNTYTWQLGDRLDKLASQHLGEGEYWWVLALVNEIKCPLSIAPGTVIKIPNNIDDVLSTLNLK
jgi:nucleoid-associated protein YgaU